MMSQKGGWGANDTDTVKLSYHNRRNKVVK